MSAVTATEFAEAFDRYKDEAQREPVAITGYGRVSGYFLSALEYEELKRRVHRIKDLPGEVGEAIQGAEMNPTHDHLNALLDETHSSAES